MCAFKLITSKLQPLPGKHTLLGQLDRYSKDFILLRMKALNVFIKRVIEHPILNCNEQLRIFLTAKQGVRKSDLEVLNTK